MPLLARVLLLWTAVSLVVSPLVGARLHRRPAVVPVEQTRR
jgi:hypothetical protein